MASHFRPRDKRAASGQLAIRNASVPAVTASISVLPAATTKKRRRHKKAAMDDVDAVLTHGALAQDSRVSREALCNALQVLTERVEELESNMGHSATTSTESPGDDASDEEVDVSSLTNMLAIAIGKVSMANDPRSMMIACGWLAMGLTSICIEFICLVAVATSLSWGKCFGDGGSCREGMACILYQNDDGSVLDPACEDCYFLAEHKGAPEAIRYPHVYEGAGNASGRCLADLADADGALRRMHPDETPSFSRCLYVQLAYAVMSNLERQVMIFAVLLVSMGIAQDWFQQHRAQMLRRQLLPCTLLPVRNSTGVRDGRAIFRWLGAYLLRLYEVFAIRMVHPVIPMGMILLLLTQGTNCAAILLNGLSITFVLAIDDLVPTLILDDQEIKGVVDHLAAAASRASARARADGHIDMHSFDAAVWTIKPMSIATTLFFSWLTVEGFDAAGRYKCEHIVHFLYYRISLAFGLWGTVLVRAVVHVLVVAGLALRRANSSRLSLRDRQVPAIVLRGAASLALTTVSAFAETLMAAFLLNIVYWWCINVSYYEDPKALDLFGDYVWDLFGTCARGPWWNGKCLDWAWP